MLQDIQGTSRAVLKSDGTVAARHDYLPFGEEIGALGSRATTPGYGGADTNRWNYGLTERDQKSGLDHTWYRKYENKSGRWTSPDPYNGSITIGDPQSLNRYSYTQSDPVNFVDPTGLEVAVDWYWVFKQEGGHRDFGGGGNHHGSLLEGEGDGIENGGGFLGNPNSSYCRGLAQKIANIQSSLISHTSALIHNPGSLK